jgi:hypothetical protein
MLREFIKDSIPADLFRPVDFLPDRRLGLLVAAIGFVFAAVIVVQKDDRVGRRFLNVSHLVSLLMIYLGLHVLTTVFVDEVFVNLEHSWNLWHFGRFSFDPYQTVDGTVELVYYLLLTPFSVSRGLLVFSSFLLGLLIGTLHFLLFWRMTADASPLLRWTSGVLFLSNLPMIATFSCGFGNSLISLVVLWAFDQIRRGEPGRAALSVAFLPLIRIDAVLVSVWFLAALYWQRENWNHLFRPLIIAGLSVVTVFGFCKFYYGHAILTPVLFKSGFDLLLESFDQWPVWVAYLRESGTPMHILALLGMAWLIKTSGLSRFDVRLAALGLPIQVFYWFSTNTQYFSLTRYWISMEVIWTVVVVRLFLDFAMSLSKETSLEANEDSVPVKGKPFQLLGATIRRITIPTASCMSLFCLIFLDTSFWGYVWPLSFPTSMWPYCAAAQLVDRVAPPEWKVAVHELNQFGFSTDRSIIDLWGYTERRTASSKTRNSMGVKNWPEQFLDARPELHWSISDSRSLRSNIAKMVTQSPEQFLTEFQNWGNRLANLGRLDEVLKFYDPVLIREGELVHLFMIRKDRVDQFEDLLTEDGYRQGRRLKLDLTEIAYRINQNRSQTFELFEE